MENRLTFKKVMILSAFTLAISFLISGCNTSNSNPPVGEKFSFIYEVPNYIENAWVITHASNGNVIESKKVSGSGKISIRGVEDGLITLFARDTYTNDGEYLDDAVIRTYPMQVAQNKILMVSTYPWLKPKEQRSVTFNITCPPGAKRVAVRGKLAAWWRDCNAAGEIQTINAFSDALANRSDGKLGAVVWAFDAKEPIAYALLEAFEPDTTVSILASDWQANPPISELHVTYNDTADAERHSLGYSIFARAVGGWYVLDTPGSYNQTQSKNEVLLPEAYAPLTLVDQAILWVWSIATITPDTEEAGSIWIKRNSTIPKTLRLDFSHDFTPYPNYVEWDYDHRGRIWVKTSISSPSTPTYYYAEVASDKDNEHRTWSIELYGDHQNGAIFPELPAQLHPYIPTKRGVDKARVGNDVGNLRWFVARSDPSKSFSGDKAWLVWRWKYVVGP